LETSTLHAQTAMAELKRNASVQQS